MLPEEATKRDGGVFFEFGIELDDGGGRLVPVRGIKNEAFALDQLESLVPFGQPNIFKPALFAIQIDRDGFAGFRRRFGEGKINQSDCCPPQ